MALLSLSLSLSLSLLWEKDGQIFYKFLEFFSAITNILLHFFFSVSDVLFKNECNFFSLFYLYF